MPDNVSSGFDKGYVDLSKAPGADTSWDDLFQNPENPAAVQPQAAPGTPPQQAPQASQPFLKAGDSVYNTAEDAARGLEYKDSLVAKYRAFLSENGFDPNSLNKVQAEPQAQPQTPSQYKYLNNGTKYYQDLAKAANPDRPDPVAYEQIQRQYQQEVLQNFLAPYGSLLAETARQRAIRQVSGEIPGFQQFVDSKEFKDTTKAIPLYKEMLDIGENNPEASVRLPEVYKAIYLTYQGLNRPANPAQPAQTAPPVTNTPTARPNATMTPSALTPPTPGPDTRNWTTNRDARKQLIQDNEARGIDKMDWSSLGT